MACGRVSDSVLYVATFSGSETIVKKDGLNNIKVEILFDALFKKSIKATYRMDNANEGIHWGFGLGIGLLRN